MTPANVVSRTNANERRASPRIAMAGVTVQVPSDPWIVRLHVAACRRWLSGEGLCLVHAERTLDLLRQAAKLRVKAGGEDAVAATATSPGRSACPELMHRQLEQLVRILLAGSN